MTSIPDEDRQELSFSEWCDRKFTNMYSHKEFVLPPSRPSTSTAPKESPKTTPAKKLEGRTDSVHRKGTRRMTSPSFNFVRQPTPRPQGQSCLQPTKSPQLDRARKTPVGSLTIRKQDETQTVAINASSVVTGSITDSGFSERNTQRVGCTVQPKNEDVKVQALACTTKAPVVSVKSGSSGQESYTSNRNCSEGNRVAPPKSEDVKVRAVMHSTEGPKVSVKSGSCSEQESHTSKRSYSELSPDKKKTWSKKYKKKVGGTESSPRRADVAQNQRVINNAAGQKQTAGNSSSDDLSSSSAGCVWKSTKVITECRKNAHKKSSIKPKEENSRIVLKEKEEDWDDEIEAEADCKQKSTEKDQHHAAVDVKLRNESRHSKGCKRADRAKKVSSGEYEVESSGGTEESYFKVEADHKEKSTEKDLHLATVDVNLRNESRHSKGCKRADRAKKVPSGEFEVESSGGSEDTKSESYFKAGADRKDKSAEIDQHLATVNVKFQNDNRHSKCCRQADRAKKVPLGEFEVESSGGSEDTKLESCTIVVNKTVCGDGSKTSGRDERPTKGDRKSSKDKNIKSTENRSTHDEPAKSNTIGKPVTKMSSANGPNSARRTGMEDSAHRKEQHEFEKGQHVKLGNQQSLKQMKVAPSEKYKSDSLMNGVDRKSESVVAHSKVKDNGSEVRRDRRVTKTRGQPTEETPTKSWPITSAHNVTAKGSTTEKFQTAVHNARGDNSEKRRKGTEGASEKRQSDDKGTQHGKKPQKTQELSAASNNFKDTNCKDEPREEKKETSGAKSIPSTKATNAEVTRAKDVHEEKRVKKVREAESRSPSPRNETSGGARLFAKCVLESVLQTSCPSRMAAKSRTKSGEMYKASEQVDKTRRKSWPASKVYLEHIHQAFDSAASSTSQEDEHSETLVHKESATKEPDKQEETSGIHDKQTSQESQLQKIQFQTMNLKQAQLMTSELCVAGARNELNKCLNKVGKLGSDATSSEKSDSKSPKLAFTPQFVPRCVSRNRKEEPGAENVHAKTDKTATISENVVDHSAEVSSSKKAKAEYIAQWLDKHDETLPGSESNEIVPSNTPIKTQKDLEPGEVSDSSSSVDEVWDHLVDDIVKGKTGEAFSSPFSKRVQQKHRISGLASMAPFRTGAVPTEELKSSASPRHKNIATVSPFCIHPPTSQPKRFTACTWSGPTPDPWDTNSPLTPSSQPFSQFTPLQKSSDANRTKDVQGSILEFGRQSQQSDAIPTDICERVPAEFSGQRDGFQSPSSSHTNAALIKPRRIKSLVDIPPRFLRLPRFQAVKNRLANVSSKSSPKCIYSGGTREENLVSTPRTCLSTRASPQPPSSLTQSGITSKQEDIPWTSGSVAWSSSLSRTPGTITPTRFTPWTSEASTPSPWKTFQHSQEASAVLSPVVDYPSSSVPYIDTHCHIDFLYQRLEFRGTFEKFSKVYKFPKNYGGCLAVFCTPEGFEKGALWEDLGMEKNVWMAFGCHPHHAKSYDGIVEENIIRCMRHPKAIALGEIGLDYSNRCTSDRPLQLQVFRRQLQIALQMGKPLVIHSRDAEHDTLSIMMEMVPRNYKIHRHCFTGSPQEARNFFQAFPNSFIGLTALVTFPTAYPVHRTASEIPLGKILLETDTPYFLPKQCPRIMRWANPSMAVFVAVRIAQLRGLPLDEVLYAVRRNTTEMYGI